MCPQQLPTVPTEFSDCRSQSQQAPSASQPEGNNTAEGGREAAGHSGASLCEETGQDRTGHIYCCRVEDINSWMGCNLL